jgi:hypothetical protein
MTSGETFAGYRIEAVAGEGRMGVVYRATQTSLARTVALKLIDPAVADDARDRFVAAARLLASIEHPHVVGVYEAGEADGRLYIAMRWVQGSDLRTHLATGGALEPVRAAASTAQIAEALDAVHVRGLAHGDVKASNILLEDEHAYLTDFGAGQADAKADIRALGAVLSQALTGSPLAWARPELPPELEAVLATAGADGYASAGDLGRAALAAVSVEPPPQPPPAPPPRRRRLALAALGVAGVVAAIGVAVLLTGSDEPSRTRQTTRPAGEPKVAHVGLGPRTAPGDVAIDARSVYVTDRRTGNLLFVDKASGEVTRRVKLPGIAYIRTDPYRANRLWASFPDRRLVLQVDTRRGKIVGDPIRVSGEPNLVAATRDAVVVSTDPRKHLLLRRYDKDSGRRLEGSIRQKGTPTDLDTSTGVNVVNWIQPAILMLDDRLAHPRWIDFKLPQGNGFFGQMATELAVGAAGTAWLLLNDSQPDSFDVVRASLRTGKQVGQMIRLGKGQARDIAVDRGTVWIPNMKGGTVVRVDERSARVIGAPIPVGELAGDMTAADGVAWVAGAHDLIRITP